MRILLSLFIAAMSFDALGQYEYAASVENPFGKLNPEAPPQVADYKDLIGRCECKSVVRIDQSSWADTLSMFWTFKYIMNGMAVQDETLKADGGHTGSIRQFIADSSRWYVHYFSHVSPSTTIPSWEGGKTENGNIVLFRDQPAPNGFAGDYRLTFSNISSEGFDWAGEWVSKDRTIVYPTWRIFCKKTVDD